jgi:menaquinone-dependent protoporphyrinogen oxidase
VQRYAQDIGAAPVVTFGGRLQPASASGFLARRMARGPLAGDHRDFDKAREWARLIAGHLAHISHVAAPAGRNPHDRPTTDAGTPTTTTRRTP